MAAVLVEYLDDAEPLTFEEVAFQCRIDDDDERDFVERIVIPGARQAAESKSGAAIRKARYVERLSGFPLAEISLSVGQVIRVDSIEIRDASGATTTLSDKSQFLMIGMVRQYSWSGGVNAIISSSYSIRLSGAPKIVPPPAA